MADLIERDALEPFYESGTDPNDTYADMTFIRAEHIENAPAVNRWISVEDALPEIKEYHISDTVLCYCDSGALAIARLEENGFGQVGFNCEKDDGYHYAVGKVLYWMPIHDIPEPPESEENSDE